MLYANIGLVPVHMIAYGVWPNKMLAIAMPEVIQKLGITTQARNDWETRLNAMSGTDGDKRPQTPVNSWPSAK
jgi:hypothetical protein